MICKVCNASFDDNAQVCPFCNTPVTVDVDPATVPLTDNMINLTKPEASSAFPDPAASVSPEPVQLTKPGEPSGAAPVSPEPVQLTKPEDTSAAAPSPAPMPGAQPFAEPVTDMPNPQQPYMDTAGAVPNGQPVQPNYGQTQNTFGQQNYSQPDYGQTTNQFNQPNYGQTPPPSGSPYGGNYSNIPDPTSEYETEASNVMTLGIIALILSVVIGFCCCALPGPIVGIVGLVKNNKLKDSLYLVSEDGQKKANLGKILCIIAIVLGALAILANIGVVASGTLTELMDELS